MAEDFGFLFKPTGIISPLSSRQLINWLIDIYYFYYNHQATKKPRPIFLFWPTFIYLFIFLIFPKSYLFF